MLTSNAFLFHFTLNSLGQNRLKNYFEYYVEISFQRIGTEEQQQEEVVMVEG